MNKKHTAHFFTKLLIDFMLIMGVIALGTIFWWSEFLKDYYHYGESFYPIFLTMLLLAGVLSLFFLWQLRMMYKAFLKGTPFVWQTAVCLNRCAICSAFIALIFLIKEIIAFTIASAIILIVFALVTLFALALRDLFKEAISYKEENDQTI